MVSVSPFQNLAKQNKFQARIVIATGWIVGLTEWIIDVTQPCLLYLEISIDPPGILWYQSLHKQRQVDR